MPPVDPRSNSKRIQTDPDQFWNPFQHNCHPFSSTSAFGCRRESHNSPRLSYSQKRPRKCIPEAPTHNFIASISGIHCKISSSQKIWWIAFRQIPITARSSRRHDRFPSTTVTSCRRKSSDLSVPRCHQNPFRELPLIMLSLLFRTYIVYTKPTKIQANRFRQILINARSSHRHGWFSSTTVSSCRRKSSDLSLFCYHQNRARECVSRASTHNFIASISDIHRIYQAQENSGESLPTDSH